MDNDYDFQRFMRGFAGAFFGAIIGAVVGGLIYLAFSVLHVGVSNTVKLAIIGVCIIVGMVLSARHEVKKHA